MGIILKGELQMDKMSQFTLGSCKQVLVVGSGLMGAGIAQVIAQAGIKVALSDLNEAYLERGKRQILKGISQKSKAEQNFIIENIIYTTEMKVGKDSDLAIDAVPEQLSIKREVFGKLDQIMKPDAVLASNTSSLSIAAISSATKRPKQVIGLHFFSPVPKMKLLEIVTGINTSSDVVEFSKVFAKQIGKETIIANDYPGFTVNRILLPMLNEAAFLVTEGNNPVDIDRGMVLGTNHPLGPLRLADLVGIDVLLFTMESLYQGFNDSKYRPCPLLKRMVEAGHLGKKTGRGFYEY